MDRLRRPFLIAALVLVVVALLIEIGAAFANTVLDIDDPPGLGIPYMAMIDGVLVYTLGLMVVSLVVPEAVIGRFQGCATLVLAIVVLLASLVLIFVAFALVMLMIGLLASFFGAPIYLAVFGDFPRGAAAVILGLLLILKIAAAVCLVLAHQRFIQNKGLVLLVLTSLVANVLVAFLHDLLPLILVSILDGVAAIIVGIFALIWAVILLVGAIVAVVRAIRVPDVAGGDEAPVRPGP